LVEWRESKLKDAGIKKVAPDKRALNEAYGKACESPCVETRAA